MSTILALWNRNGEPVNESVVRSMLDLNLNPENDGQDYWMSQDIALGRQHFWISPQEKEEYHPRVDPENGCVLTCAARLDNRPELARILGLSGSQVSHISDADLILKAYGYWGIECPRFLLGDFAFVLWDPAKRMMLAARDVLGVQELFYTLSRQYLILATSISMLLRHPGVEPQLNPVKVAGYLALEWGDDSNTFYHSIFHLPPAHQLVVTSDGSQLTRYWNLDAGKTLRYSHPRQYAEHYQELLLESLRSRLRCAYPVGVSLSGGIDSSALTCLAAQVLPSSGLPQQDLGCYSYVFNELPNCDERAFILPAIEMVAGAIPIRPVMIPGDSFGPGPLDADWPIRRDYPFQDPYSYLLRAVLQAGRRDGLRLMVSGFYGDDLYSGSEYLFADLMLEFRFRQAADILRASKNKVQFKRDLLDYGLRAMIHPVLKKYYRSLHPMTPEWNAWVHPNFAVFARQAEHDSSESHPNIRLPGSQKRYSALFLTGYPQTVSEFQATAHSNGMEYVFPFMDRHIVEFVLALPPEQIALPGFSRRVLRNSVYGKLPESVRLRQGKTGLMDLYNRAIYRDGFQKIREVFKHSQVLERGFIREDWLTVELDARSCTRAGFILWLVLSLETWLRKYW